MSSIETKTHSPWDVQVVFKEKLLWGDVYKYLAKMHNPEVFLWYIGAYGLKLSCVEYYKKKIGTMLRMKQSNISVSVCDLSGWSAFRDENASLTTIHSCAKQINEMLLANLRCISFPFLYADFKEDESAELKDLSEKIASRPFVFKTSKQFENTGINMEKVLKGNCPSLQNIYEMDSSKCYSFIQYLEGLGLVKSVVQKRIKTHPDNVIDVVFALPNDEAKYYRDEENSFAKDIARYLEIKIGKKNQTVRVHFLNFDCGPDVNYRPYNGDGESIKSVQPDQITSFYRHGGENDKEKEKENPLPLCEIPTAVPGFANYSIEDQILFEQWKKELSDVYKMNGYMSLDLPPFVRKEFLMAKGGISHEIYSVGRLQGERINVEKGEFQEENNERTPFGIAFDRTVPFALWVRDHITEIPMPFKRYDINLSYRGEKPAPGRFRGFYQCDVDVVGRNLSLENDSQCISTLVQGLAILLKSGIKNPENRKFTMYLNHIGIPKSMLRQYGFSEEKIPDALRIIDKLEKIGSEEVSGQLKDLMQDQEIEKGTIDVLVRFFSHKGKLEDLNTITSLHLPNDARKGMEDLKVIFENLKASGISDGIINFCPGMVRGLNYYTGVVFETFLDALPPKAGSVMSGGRYDGLVDAFSKKPTGIEGVGGSIGLTRFYDVLQRGGLIIPIAKTSSSVLIVSRGHFENSAMKIASVIRENNIPCDIYTGNAKKKLTKQLDFANQIKIPICLIIFDENTFAVRKMSTKEQSSDFREISECIDQIRKYIQE